MVKNLDVKLIWKNVKQQVMKKISQIAYDVWIETLMPMTVIDDELVLVAPFETSKNTINANYKDIIDSCLKGICPFLIGIRVITESDTTISDYAVDNTEDVSEDENVSLIEQTYEDTSYSSQFEEKYTFDNFVVGASNQIAYAAAKAVADNPGVQHNPLFIYGGVGLGKTHIMHAIGNHILSSRPNKRIMYVNTESFINDFIDSIQKSKHNDLNRQFRDKYRNVDVLMLDDIQFISGKTTTQEALFHTFNELYHSKKQIVFTSDRHPSELNNIDDRLKSRFQSGLTVDISSPDIETRIAILRRKAFQNNFTLPKDVIEFIAENISSNIRELEGALAKVKFYCDLNRITNIDISIVQRALKDEMDNKIGPISMDLITNCVCDYFNVDINDIMSKKRSSNVTEPRQIAIYLISEIISVPLVNIGLFFNRDHSTVIHARNKVKEILQSGDQQYNTYIKDIRNLIDLKKS